MTVIFYPDVDEANAVIDALAGRNAELENVAKAIGQRCHLRQDGHCDLHCLGRILCDCKNLVSVQELDRQVGIISGPPPDPSCIDPTD